MSGRPAWRSADRLTGSGRFLRFLSAGAVSLALHGALVPAVVDLFGTASVERSSTLAPIAARLSPEPPPAPAVAPAISEPELERPVKEAVSLPLPEDPVEIPPSLPPTRLAHLDITIPESAYGAHVVPASTQTHRAGSLHVPARVSPTTPPSPEATPETLPVAPLFPEDPPEALRANLPAHAVRLGKLSTLYGSESENELRRRVYAQTYYPEAAADLELEGVVIVGFRVDSDGHPRNLQVTNPDECPTLLQEEALSMVRSGAPYPVPESTQDLSVTIAVAYLNTPSQRGERVKLLLSSGVPALDQHARQMAAQDALQNTGEGWHLALYQVDASVTVRPGAGVVSPRLNSYQGDARLQRVVLESLHQLLPAQKSSAFLKIPIQFRILDR